MFLSLHSDNLPQHSNERCDQRWRCGRKDPSDMTQKHPIMMTLHSLRFSDIPQTAGIVFFNCYGWLTQWQDIQNDFSARWQLISLPKNHLEKVKFHCSPSFECLGRITEMQWKEHGNGGSARPEPQAVDSWRDCPPGLIFDLLELSSSSTLLWHCGVKYWMRTV